LSSCAELSEAEVSMTHRRQKSPGSFQDELGGVIERIAPPKHDKLPSRNRPPKPPVKDAAELNDRLFKKAWRKAD
jgi:hypothetical protein